MFMPYYLVLRLTREIHDLESRMARKQIEISNHQKYASRLGSSSILTLNNVAGLAPGIFPRASLFAQYSDQASSMSAMQNLQMMKMMGRVPFTGNQMMQMQIEMSAFNEFKQASLKALKDQEIAQMNEVEKQIQLELTSLEQELKMKREQLKSYKELLSSRMQELAPKFGLK